MADRAHCVGPDADARLGEPIDLAPIASAESDVSR